MTSAAVPWMKGFAESTRLRSVSRSIRSLMHFAQNSAITQRNEYVVLFDVANDEYWLSLLELIDPETGTDSSRESLSESLDLVNSSGLSEEEEAGQDEGEEDYTPSRTGGILGIPKEITGGIHIVHIVSPRSTSEVSDVDYVTFYPDGTAEDFELYLQNDSGRTFLLNVASATGRVAISELSVQDVEELGLETYQEE
jgi:hypothetical protein